jgi:hypothetical protein
MTDVAEIEALLNQVLQEMAATRAEMRALVALTTRVAEKMEAVVREIERARRASEETS